MPYPLQLSVLRIICHCPILPMSPIIAPGGQNALGPMYLFYGCQHPDKNNLHHEERSRMVKTGIITKEYTAFSRLNKNKVDIQPYIEIYND